MLVLTSTDKLLTTMLKIVDIFYIHILLHNFFNTTPMKSILQNIISKTLLLAGRASTREPKAHIWVKYVGFILWYRVTFLLMLSFVKYYVIINHDSMRVICIFIITSWFHGYPMHLNFQIRQKACLPLFLNIFSKQMGNYVTFSKIITTISHFLLCKVFTRWWQWANNEGTSPCFLSIIVNRLRYEQNG